MLYQLIPTEKEVAIDAKFQITENNNFKLAFTLQLPQTLERKDDQRNILRIQ